MIDPKEKLKQLELRRKKQRERDAVELDERYYVRAFDGFGGVKCQNCLMIIAPTAAINPPKYCDECAAAAKKKLKVKVKVKGKNKK